MTLAIHVMVVFLGARRKPTDELRIDALLWLWFEEAMRRGPIVRALIYWVRGQYSRERVLRNPVFRDTQI
jgi:hypothetical protein